MNSSFSRGAANSIRGLAAVVALVFAAAALAVPDISGHPQSQTVSQGQAVALSVTLK